MIVCVFLFESDLILILYEKEKKGSVFLFILFIQG